MSRALIDTVVADFPEGFEENEMPIVEEGSGEEQNDRESFKSCEE